MRISTRKKDPSFCAGANLFRVLLDGKECAYCFTADEERGEAKCLILIDGVVMIDRRTKEPKEMTLKGHVQILKKLDS